MRRLTLLLAVVLAATAADRTRYNFNPDWKVLVGDHAGAEAPAFDDSGWKSVSLPNAWNPDDRAAGTAWYRKHFKLPSGSAGPKVFLEFEGVWQAGELYLNGKSIGRHEKGLAAFGFDVSAVVKPAPQENVLAVRVRNPDGTYGGIANVWLHVTSKLHQTLPLYSSLGTTGVSIYAQFFDITGHSARITADSQVKNEFEAARTFTYEAVVEDIEGRPVATLDGGSHTLRAGETSTVSASEVVEKLHFWSWGYGYLYTVSTVLKVNGQAVDTVETRTGFRKTEFASGAVKLNDRAIQLKGYAVPAANAWPLVGPAVPAWLSDFGNRMIVDGNGNLVRWTAGIPSRQEMESCDRVGLMEVLPADAVEVMRDAMVYNRNNPSIVFYEAGNEEQVSQVKALRAQFDPNGGRAVGGEGLAADAEYGGEKSQVDKSAGKPLWAMGYASDRPIEAILSWFGFWTERPGTGSRVSAGGVTKLDVGAMRLPRNDYFSNQVMWDGWVDTEHPLVRIIGHWSYSPGTKRDVQVVSNADRVELRLNNQSLGYGQRSSHFLFTYPNVEWQEGMLQAIAYDAGGRRVAMTRLDSAGAPAYISLNLRSGHEGLMADGSDLALVDVEIMDGMGRRCPTATNPVKLTVAGPAELLGGANLTMQDGIGRVFLRATNQAGRIVLQANSPGIQLGVIDLISRPVVVTAGVSSAPVGEDLQPYLGKGPTPSGASFKISRVPIHIASAIAGSNSDQAGKTYDDDEATKWESDGQAGTAWIECQFDEAVSPTQLVVKLEGFRNGGQAIRVTVDGTEVFAGAVPGSLGYATVPLKSATGRSLRIEGTGAGKLGLIEVEIYH